MIVGNEDTDSYLLLLPYTESIIGSTWIGLLCHFRLISRVRLSRCTVALEENEGKAVDKEWVSYVELHGVFCAERLPLYGTFSSVVSVLPFCNLVKENEEAELIEELSVEEELMLAVVSVVVEGTLRMGRWG